MNEQTRKYIALSVIQETNRYHDVLGVSIIGGYFSLQHFIKGMKKVLPVEDHNELYVIIFDVIHGYFNE